MENSQSETLKPFETSFAFPPHRRRHLQSETYRTLAHILSHCYGESQRNRPFQAAAAAKDPPPVELGEIAEHNEVVCHDPVESGRVVGPDHMEVEKLAVQEKETVDVNGIQFKDFIPLQMEIDEPGNKNGMEGNEEFIHGNGISIARLSGDKDQNGDNQEITSTAPQAVLEDFKFTGDLDIDEEHNINDICEAIDFCFGTDFTSDSAIPLDVSEENKSALERNLFEQQDLELQQKDMELEQLISTSGDIDSHVLVTANDEVEEGEISGDIDDISMDFLFENAASLETQNLENEQVGAIGKGEAIGSEHKKELVSGTELVSSIGGSVDNVTNNVVGGKSKMSVSGTSMELKKADEHGGKLEFARIGNPEISKSATAFPENLAWHEKISEENATETLGTASTEKDADFLKKKKKRGPPTTERKAKKKKKERIKRAEKNRKLGVKRLKLEPVLKPKKVSYCKHYIKGRCHEGENCKFSHDTVPLTKSKPCCHFARHSCMKGDDCPYDHQLSKYPCNNFLSNGFCGRGADCMFSHQVPKEGDLTTTSNVAKPESNSVSHHNFSNRKEQKNTDANPKQNPNPKSSVRSSTKHDAADPKPKPSAQPTPGISFLSSSQVDSSKQVHNLSEDSNRAAKVVPKGINFLSFSKTPLDSQSLKSAQNMNEMEKRTPPKGLNFLSFGKAPVDGSSSSAQQRPNAASPVSCGQSLGQLGGEMHSQRPPGTFQPSLLSNTPSSLQKTLQSTLAFAAKFDSEIKPVKASFFDLVYRDGGKTKK